MEIFETLTTWWLAIGFTLHISISIYHIFQGKVNYYERHSFSYLAVVTVVSCYLIWPISLVVWLIDWLANRVSYSASDVYGIEIQLELKPEK